MAAEETKPLLSRIGGESEEKRTVAALCHPAEEEKNTKKLDPLPRPHNYATSSQPKRPEQGTDLELGDDVTLETGIDWFPTHPRHTRGGGCVGCITKRLVPADLREPRLSTLSTS